MAGFYLTTPRRRTRRGLHDNFDLAMVLANASAATRRIA
jgi:hypothetical protein